MIAVIRYGKAIEAKRANIVLLTGQFAFEADTKILKIGDGVTRYNDLEGFNMISKSELTTLQMSLSALQRTLKQQIDQKPATGNFGTLTGLINGTNRIFYVSKGKYEKGKLIVYDDGVLRVQGTDYTETNPATGRLDFLYDVNANSILTAIY